MYWTADPLPCNVRESRIEQESMSNIPTSRSPSQGALRMRRYRKQQKQGLRPVRILLDETDVDAFIRLGLLKEDQRQDEEALRTAEAAIVMRHARSSSAR
jgi:hypothetical protein